MYPIGTILTVKGNENLLMIVGLLVTNDKTNIIYEYAACKYPLGVVGEKEYILFNEENIENILHKGLESKNHNEYVEMCKAVNHYGEYSNIHYDIETYDKFLEIKKKIQKGSENTTHKENTTQGIEYVEL